MKLTTNRLILRALSSRDISDIVESANDLEVSKWVLAIPYPYTVKDARDWVNHVKGKSPKKKTDYTFAIELKSEKKLIGAIGIHKVDMTQGKADVGYWIGTKYHRKGYGTEALGEVLKFIFTKLKLRKVNAGVFVGNPSSSKLLEHYGFKLEGLKRQECVCKADGKIKDEYLYGLLKDDWIRS